MTMQIWNNPVSFSRGADTTQYSVGDLVANSTVVTSVLPMVVSLGNSFPQGQTRITRARLSKANSVATSASFRIHLYDAQPTPTNGDNGAWLTNKSANWLGNIDISSMLSFSDGAAGTGSAVAGSEMFVRATSGKVIYAYLAALSTYSPTANETFTLTLEDVATW